MKKLFCLFLVGILSFSFCSCGKKAEDSTVLTSKDVVEESKKTKEPYPGDIRNEIKFEPEEVVAEDENVKITLMGFWETYYNFIDNPRWPATCSVKVYNKTDENMTVNIENAYINDEKLTCVNSSTNGTLKGGKSEVITFYVELDAGYQNTIKSYTAENLYDLEAEAKIWFPDRKDYHNMGYEIPFNFSDLK